MKGYILWLLIIFLSASAFYFLLDTPSYILISFKSYTIETTLLSFILCCSIFFTVLYIIKSILWFFLGTIPSYCTNLIRNKKYILNQFNKGIIHTLLGDWQTAYKCFAYTANTKEKNFIYVISASLLASKTKNYSIAKNLLLENQSYYTETQHHDIVNILLAKIYIEQEQYKQAYAFLVKLNEKYPSNLLILPMLITTLQHSNDWQHLLKLLPNIKKINLLSAAKYAYLEAEVISGVFDTVIKQIDNIKNLQQDVLQGKLNYNWDQLPVNYKKNPTYIGIYAKSLIKANCNELATRIIEKYLNDGIYDLNLISIYSNLKVDNYALQLKILQNLEHEFKHNYKLIFFLGRAYLNNKLLGKAYAYFEKSVSLQKNVLAYKGIADICLLENKPEQAIKYFNQAFNVIEEQSNP